MFIVTKTQTASVESGSATRTATFELGTDGSWAAQVVEVPEDQPGPHAHEARVNVEDALALDLRAQEGREIPLTGRVAVAPVSPAR